MMGQQGVPLFVLMLVLPRVFCCSMTLKVSSGFIGTSAFGALVGWRGRRRDKRLQLVHETLAVRYFG